jgi:hypothetical protein
MPLSIQFASDLRVEEAREIHKGQIVGRLGHHVLILT